MPPSNGSIEGETVSESSGASKKTKTDEQRRQSPHLVEERLECLPEWSRKICPPTLLPSSSASWAALSVCQWGIALCEADTLIHGPHCVTAQGSSSPEKLRCVCFCVCVWDAQGSEDFGQKTECRLVGASASAATPSIQSTLDQYAGRRWRLRSC